MLDIAKPRIGVNEIDIEDVYNAIKKNGYVHLRGQWIDYAGKGACVLGQAGLNLKIATNEDHDEQYSLYNQLSKYYNNAEKWGVPTGGGDTYFETLAGTIIHWNDRTETIRPDDGPAYTKYSLETYDDVVDMCYDVLKPYFGTKIQVLDYDYATDTPASQEDEEWYDK